MFWQKHIGTIRKRLGLSLEKGCKLFGYQLHTVLWMFLLERQIMAKQYFVIGGNDLRFSGDPYVHTKIWKVLYKYILVYKPKFEHSQKPKPKIKIKNKNQKNDTKKRTINRTVFCL